MADIAVVYEAFRHFYHLDCSNAAVHTAEVRFSPITFRLQEFLTDSGFELDSSGPLAEVWRHNGKYEEDKGR